jgi:hypothetical protein
MGLGPNFLEPDVCWFFIFEITLSLGYFFFFDLEEPLDMDLEYVGSSRYRFKFNFGSRAVLGLRVLIRVTQNVSK